MKAFITGGSGFLGMPLVERLLKEGHEVTVLDVTEPAIKDPKLTWINKSIMDNLTGDIKGHDIVFHFAALLGVVNSDGKPLETMRVNLEGSVNVFRSALEAGVKHMIYASSSEVYGNPRELPIKEESVKGPVSNYGVSKLAAEIYAKAYNHEFGTEIKIVRFFNAYGPRQSDSFVVPIFITKAMKNEDLQVFGDGSQTRCFSYVDDIIDGVMTVVAKGKAGQAYNIGNDQPTTIFELAEIINAATKGTGKVARVGFGKETRLKSREVNYRVPDISKMRALGWKPTTLIKEGVEKIISYRKSKA